MRFPEHQLENRPEEFLHRIKMFQILVDLESFQKYFGSKIFIASKILIVSKF